ncbi:MAG: cytochrome b [Alphaproteobacteria bacterium]|nr:cytochrome b [Alphaproteobacteria bacterium]
MIQNTRNSYGSIAKLFHWTIAFLIIGMYILANIMMYLSPSVMKYSLYDLHKSTGLLIFSLVLLRLIWRWINPSPMLPLSVPRVQKIASQINTILLYMLMIIFPISGGIMTTMSGHPIKFYNLFVIQPLYYNLNSIAKAAREIHGYSAYALCILVSLHTLAAFYHHFVIKDQILRRMLPKRN